MSQIQVRDTEGIGIPLINVRLGINGQDVDGAYDDKFTDYSGNTAWPNPLPSSDGYSLFVNYRNVLDEYQEKTVHFPNLDNDVVIILLSKPVVLDRIKMDGSFYLNKFIQGESAFLDYYKFLRNEDIKPLLEQSERLRSNCRRNFLMTYNTGNAGGIGPQEPEMYGDSFYDRFGDFLDLYSKYGLYIYASVFPDNGLFSNWSGNTSKQVKHWDKLKEIGRTFPNFFALELTNEPDSKSYNQVDTDKFSPDNTVLCCSGSRGPTGADPMPDPQWNFCDFHQPRQYPNSVVDSCVANHPSRLHRNKAVGLGEPLGFGTEANRESNSRIAKEIAGSAKGTAAFVFFHSTNGGFSRLYNNVEMECAEEFFGVL